MTTTFALVSKSGPRAPRIERIEETWVGREACAGCGDALRRQDWTWLFGLSRLRCPACAGRYCRPCAIDVVRAAQPILQTRHASAKSAERRSTYRCPRCGTAWPGACIQIRPAI